MHNPPKLRVTRIICDDDHATAPTSPAPHVWTAQFRPGADGSADGCGAAECRQAPLDRLPVVPGLVGGHA